MFDRLTFPAAATVDGTACQKVKTVKLLLWVKCCQGHFVFLVGDGDGNSGDKLDPVRVKNLTLQNSTSGSYRVFCP